MTQENIIALTSLCPISSTSAFVSLEILCVRSGRTELVSEEPGPLAALTDGVTRMSSVIMR